MTALEMLITLGNMGYTKNDIEKLMGGTQPPTQYNPYNTTYGYPPTQTQKQLKPTSNIEEELKKLTQAIQLNNVNTIGNTPPKATTAEDVLASIINPPTNIPENTIK